MGGIRDHQHLIFEFLIRMSTKGVGESRQICQEHMKLEHKSFISYITRLAALKIS